MAGTSSSHPPVAHYTSCATGWCVRPQNMTLFCAHNVCARPPRLEDLVRAPFLGGSVFRLSVLDVAIPTLHTCASSLCMCCSDITPRTARLSAPSVIEHRSSVPCLCRPSVFSTFGGCLTKVNSLWRLFTCSPFAQPHVLLCVTFFTPCSPGLSCLGLLVLVPLQAPVFTYPQLCFSARHIGQALVGVVNLVIPPPE
jgi:hypothetical protein